VDGYNAEHVNKRTEFTLLSESESNYVCSKLIKPMREHFGCSYHSAIDRLKSMSMLVADSATPACEITLRNTPDGEIVAASLLQWRREALLMDTLERAEEIAHEAIHGIRVSLHKREEVQPDKSVETVYHMFQGLNYRKLGHNGKAFYIIEELGCGAEEAKTDLDTTAIVEKMFGVKKPPPHPSAMYIPVWDSMRQLTQDPLVKRILASAELRPMQSNLWRNGRSLLKAFDAAYDASASVTLNYVYKGLSVPSSVRDELRYKISEVPKECQAFILAERQRAGKQAGQGR